MTVCTTFPCQNNGMGTLYSSADRSDFDQQEKTLLQDGWQRYFFSDAPYCLAASYQKEGRAIHSYWIPATSQLRVIRENSVPFPSFDIGEKHCDGRLIHFGFDFTDKLILEGHTPLAKTAAGQSEILVLKDGSFVIIDGGVAVDNVQGREDYIAVALEKYATRLYALLRENNHRPDGRIIISAWIFTHLHRDHCTLFSHFAEKYGKNGVLELKYILYNYPLGNQMSHNTPLVQDKDPYMLMKHIASAHFSHTPTVLVPHTGHRISLCDWIMEVLITYEDAYPVNPWAVSSNNCSMVFRLTPSHPNDKRPAILFLGDAYAEESEQLLTYYGKSLYTPIVQSAHHGYDNGGTEALYTAIGATHVLWTHSHARWAPENRGKTGIGPNWMLKAANGQLAVYPQCNAHDQAVNWHLTFDQSGAIHAEEELQHQSNT